MTRLPVKDWIFKIATILVSLLLFQNHGKAQPECRSVLGAHLKPIVKSLPVNWATEITLSPGAMADRQIFNGMAYLGLEYVSKSMKHQLYFEGAYKYWYSTTDGPGLNGTGTGYSDFNKPEKKHLGFREAFYSHSNWLEMKAGIQTMKSSRSMLLDERVLGISAQKDWNAFTLDLKGGTVYDDIARMQDVCGTRHLYNLVRGSKVNFVGDKILDSNFFLAELNWVPGKKAVSVREGSDEFGAFESNNEFSEFSVTEEKAKFIQLRNVSFRLYEEFGKVFPDYKYYTGSTFEFEVLKSFQIDAEAIGQWMEANNAIIWKTGIQREKISKNGAFSSVRIEYLGMYEIDPDVKHFPAYSNLFKGEVMRLDIMHLPLLEIEIAHRFANSLKSGIKCNYIQQLKNDKTRELDLIYSIQPWKHMNLHAIAAYMQSELMEKDNFLLKLEARFAF